MVVSHVWGAFVARRPTTMTRAANYLRGKGPGVRTASAPERDRVTSEPTFVMELPVGHVAIHDLTVGAAGDGAPVVLAVHGITSNGLAWAAVAEEVDRRHGSGAVRFLAPDLRGRGASRAAGGPFGIATHAQDLATIATMFGAHPVLLGHSMGAFVTALAGALHPDVFSGVVLADGGLALTPPPGADVDATITALLGPAFDRLRLRFPDPEAGLDLWQRHPALGPVLRGPHGLLAREHLRHDLVPAPDGCGDWVSSCALDVVRADASDVLLDPSTRGAVDACLEAGLPVQLLWARRGLLDEPQGLYDEDRLAALEIAEHVWVEPVEANHYSLVLAEPGVSAVVDALDRALIG